MTNEDLRSRRLELEDDIRLRRARFADLRNAGQTDAADRLREDSRPLFVEHHELAALEEYRRAVPLRWTHNVEETAVERAIKVPALVAATKEFTDGSRNLLLLGPTGIGKSTALALLVRRFYLGQRSNRFPAVRWFYARELAAAVFEHPLGRGECPAVRHACRAPVLVLDDLGLEKDHGAILDVIHERYETSKVTWTSSGLSIPQLRERYGEAVYRRLVEVAAKPGRVVSCFAKTQKREET